MFNQILEDLVNNKSIKDYEYNEIVDANSGARDCENLIITLPNGKKLEIESWHTAETSGFNINLEN